MPGNAEIKARLRGDIASARERALVLSTEAPKKTQQKNAFHDVPGTG